MRYVGAMWERIKEFKIPNLMEIFLMERWKIAIFCRLNERRESTLSGKEKPITMVKISP